MTDLEINERLFDIVLPNIFPGQKHNYQQTGDSIAVWVTGGCQNTIEYFSPSTSVDALRKWVLPEVERRGLDVDFMVKMHDIMMPTPGPLSWACITAPPAVLAAAALAVLEDDNAA